MLPQLWQNFQNIAVFKTIFKNTLCQLVNQKHVKLDYFFWKLHLKLMLFFLSWFNFIFRKEYKKQAQMFYQSHSLALHTVEIFCNLILRNVGLGLEKILELLEWTWIGFMIYWSYTWKVLRLPWIWTDFMIYWACAWKALGLTYLL